MSINSSYWIDLDDFDKSNPSHLAKVKLGISKFVNILCEKTIPVEFRTKDSESYTDGNTVVIGSDITSENIDSVVGLALHEASHILLTDFGYFKGLQLTLPSKHNIHNQYQIDLVMNLVNFVEDRRIDNYVYKNAPGYRAYYDSLYERYFYNKKLDKLLQSDKGTDHNNIDDYMFRIINIFNSKARLDALPALEQIRDLIDIKNIGRLQSVEDSTEVALQIYELIKHCPIDDKILPKEGGRGNSKGKNSKEEEGETNKDIKRILENQKEFLKGESKKAKLSQSKIKQVKEEEENIANQQEIIDNKGKVIITEKWEKYFQYKKPKNHTNSAPHIVGFNLGKKLLRQLSFIRDERSDKFRGIKRGKFDTKSAYKLKFDNNVFYRVDNHNPRKTLLYISLDLSDSMTGPKLRETLITMYSFAYVSCFLDNFDVVVTFRGEDMFEFRFPGDLCSPVLAYVFDSRKHDLNKLKTITDVRTCGGTPEGICYDFIYKDMVNHMNPQTDVYLLNVSDGMPTWDYWEGQDGIEYTRNMVNKIKRAGIGILSYFVEDKRSALSGSNMVSYKGKWNMARDIFKYMYGKDACYININDINQVSKSINNLLMSKVEK